MTIRERLEQQEYMLLAPNAQKAAETKGRLYPAEENEVRTCYQRDADRIVHSKSFRRLMHKTQVFLSPEGDHYRTRMTHTLEVSRIARTICRALRLNEDLAEAAAYGHDLGHTPFGHAGEAALSDMMGTPFHHNEQSLRVVDKLERDGDGLNLTYEVRMAILGHTGPRIPETLEGQVVRTSDRIAYINHDIEDAIRAGILQKEELPQDVVEILGDTKTKRITKLVGAVVEHGSDTIGMAPEIQAAHDKLHAFMFEKVYYNPIAKQEENKAKLLLETLYTYFISHVSLLPAEYLSIAEKEDAHRAVCDYISGMSDGYAVDLYQELFIPKGWK